jgi:hypothetical protein
MSIVVIVAALVVFCFGNTEGETVYSEKDPPLGSGLMFDSIAPYYDTANSIMSLGQHHTWRKYVLNHEPVLIVHLIIFIQTLSGSSDTEYTINTEYREYILIS